MRSIWGGLVKIVTGEWILDWPAGGENGGGVILARALWSALIGYGLLFLTFQLLEENPQPTRQWLVDNVLWFGAIFGGSYASLHTRYSSQWSYLANLYNQIKAAEVGGPKHSIDVARWKLGFIEDAHTLHLARKPLFSSIVAHWGHEASVRRELCAQYSDRGKARLLETIDRATQRYEQHYGPRPSKDHENA